MQVLSAGKGEMDGSAGIFSSILADMTKHCKAILAEIVDAETVEKLADTAQEELYNAVQKQQVFIILVPLTVLLLPVVFYLPTFRLGAQDVCKVCFNSSENFKASSDNCRFSP